MKFRTTVACLAALALAAALGCSSKSVTLDLTPNPIIVGLLDTKATIHAHVVAKGYSTVPFNDVRFSVYDSKDALLASTTEKIQPTGGDMVMDRDYSVPLNGALVALSGAKFLTVRIYDPQNNLIVERRLDVVVHALKGMPLPGILQPQESSATSAPASPAPVASP